MITYEQWRDERRAVWECERIRALLPSYPPDNPRRGALIRRMRELEARFNLVEDAEVTPVKTTTELIVVPQDDSPKRTE